ncbi:MAG: M20/M25/M40 family metallo-hydrolase [Phototrophicaceae bacterium]
MNDVINQYIDAHLDDYLEELKTLLRIPTISAQKKGIPETVDLVKTMLEKRGLSVQIYATAGNPVVVGRGHGTSDKTLMFYNHYDVQPPEPLDLWTTPAFEPTIRDGKLFARGAGDDKGEFVSRLAALDAVMAAHDGILPCNVIFVVEGEEEIGSPNLAPFILDNADDLACDACIWEFGGIDDKGHPTGYLGLRGALMVELFVKTMSRDAHSGDAHLLPSAAWRLVKMLNTLKDDEEHILIEGFYEGIMLASEADKRLFAELPEWESDLKERYQIDTFVNGLSGQDFREAVFNPTCNIQGITTGYQDGGGKTVIPADASVKIDFRLVPGQSVDDIEQKLRAHLDKHGFTDIEMVRHGGIAPYKQSIDNPFVQLVVETGTEVFGKQMVINPMTGGSGPIALFGETLNIPIGFAGVNYPGGKFHAPDEHVILDVFVQGAKHNAHILDRFAGLA